MSSTDTPLGASTRIFLAYGAADGVWVVAKSNWTGKALMAPRTRYKDLRARRRTVVPAHCGGAVLDARAGFE